MLISSGNHIDTPPVQSKKLLEAAEKLEAGFLTEMFKSAGLGKSRESFGGGAGEDQFSSFLVSEYANATVAAGGIGLAEVIYRAMTSNEGAS